MTTHTTTAVLAVAVTSLALAACGGGEGSGGGKSNREEMEEYALRQAECMRQQGVDVPDPEPGKGLLMDNRGVNPEEFERAQRACEKKLGKPPAPDLTPEQQREFRDRALKFARCMRANGIDMDDPTFGANGEVQIKVTAGDGRDPESDPAFKAAEDKCSKYQMGNEGEGG